MPKDFFRFPSRLREGVVVSRPNRFIMMVRARGKTLRCHCPTTGRLGDLKLEGLPCLFSSSKSPVRKTRYTVEAVSASKTRRDWIGINQTAANRYFEFFLRSGRLQNIASGVIKREVMLGKSRIDFLVGDAYVEVKTPLIMLPAGPTSERVRRGRFDSFDRLIRHMGELRASLAQGNKAKIVLCFLYDAKPFIPPPPDGSNEKILAAAKSAERAGVERWQVNMKMSKEGVSLIRYFRSRPYTGA